MNFSLFVSCPKGLEYLLEEELRALGLQVTRVSPQGVYGEASLAILYQLCVWSRLANRVQLLLFSGQAHNESTLYQLCHQFPWQTVFAADKTLAIEFHGSSQHIRNSMFGAQVVKDAIVDYFRRLENKRPTVDRENPEILLHAHLKHDSLTVSLDLTGYSLHQRGYRTKAGTAPLKENVAAALLLRAQWPKLAAADFALHDPFCGSGTLVIEAAMMAAHIAPGLLRDDQALHHWQGHQPSLWEKVRHQALQQVKPVKIKLLGSDQDASSVSIAKRNAERAGVASLVNFEVVPLANCEAPSKQGLLICNPPYGERMGDPAPLIPLYQQLGRVIQAHYQGWQVAFLTSNPMLAKATGLRAGKQYSFYNGALECKLYCVPSVGPESRGRASGKWSAGAEMFANRLQKNFHHLQKWAKRNHVQCYRVYDADLPEYAYAIDLYDDYVVLQEYAPPSSIAPHKAEQRSLDVLEVVPKVLNIPPEKVVLKQRRRQKGTNQYQKLNRTHQSLIVQEGKARFKVNLYDYLDTGLFLDHRLMRLRFANLPSGTRFLNCFCYTATASVHAALAGAVTTNVDLSNTYLRWAEENFKLNHLALAKHQFIQQDCLKWLQTARGHYDVIFLDPPSFSNSKRMSDNLDIKRDQALLITAAMRLLEDEGILYFSTNLRHFKLSPLLLERYHVRDITAETIDLDFKRNQRIHQCFMITKQNDAASSLKTR